MNGFVSFFFFQHRRGDLHKAPIIKLNELSSVVSENVKLTIILVEPNTDDMIRIMVRFASV